MDVATELLVSLQSLSERVARLHNCLDFEEIQDWLMENKEFLGTHFSCEVPKTLCFYQIRNISDVNAWSFYMWVDGYCEKFLSYVMPILGFKYHWAYRKLPSEECSGMDSYFSMNKNDWTIMKTYERIIS